jgi:nucleoside-triphosphatase THEP1
MKTKAELQKLPEDSTDIYRKSSIDRYKERPEALEQLCLADFIAKFTFTGRKLNDDVDEENIEQEDHVVQANDDNQNEDGDGEFSEVYHFAGGTLRKRKQTKIIRFCRYDFHKDSYNFYRERLMLFKPWRDESLELENEELNLQDVFIQNKELIEQNSKQYIRIDIDFNEIARTIEEELVCDEEEPNNQEHDDDQEEHLNVYDFDDNIIQPNAMFDMGLETTHTTSVESNRITVPDLIPDQEYYELVNSLNSKQHDHLMHVLNAFKLNELPLYHFVSGEAGVGKSRLIKALYQTLMRHFNKDPGPVDTPEILIVAYTGKAAHNVNGLTAHTAFSLIMAEGNKESGKDIGSETLNTLRVKLKNLKLIIIDEISMMGIRTFEKINKRLMQVFQSKKEFGGRSVITFGDFQQLRPVKDNFIFGKNQNGVEDLFGNHLWEKFKMFELTEIMRQRDDLTFAQLLGRLAKGGLTLSDKHLISTRTFVDDPRNLKPGDKLLPEEGKNCCRLNWLNNDVDAYNNKRMQELRSPNEPVITFKAVDKISGACSEVQKRQVRYSLQNSKYQNTQGLPSELILQKGVHYMITSNIDVSDGLYNGGVGKLMFMEFKGGMLFNK